MSNLETGSALAGSAPSEQEPTADDLRRSHECLGTLLSGLRLARRMGGKDAKLHVGDVIGLIEAYQRGDMDGKSDAERAPVVVPPRSPIVQ